ncbi:MAG: hypothetical protein JSS12_08260 [Verrucomicrobia bacterium]|nr:hypothetical protein [Verrucomicrobiota bacterium]
MITAPLDLPKPILFAKEVHEIIGVIIDSASSFVTSVEHITGRVYQVAQKCFAILGFLGFAGATFSLVSFASNITKAVQTSSCAERVKNLFKAAVDVGDTWGAVNGFLWAFEAVNVISKNALSWTPFVSAILFPSQVISLGLDMHDHADTKEMRNQLMPILRAKDLTRACGYVVEHQQTVRKFLHFSKATELQKRAETLFNRLQAGELQAETDATAFIEVLKTRVNTKYNLEVAALATKVATVASTAVSIAMPLNVVSWGITAIGGIASTIIFGLQKLLLNKNPFSSPRDLWYERAFHAVRLHFNQLTQAIERRAAV